MSKLGQVEIEFSAKTDGLQKQIDGLNTRIRTSSKAWDETGGHSVSSMQSSAAAIRLLDNPMAANVRTLERFISQSKIASSIFSAAFPIAGAVAAGAMVVRLGKEIQKAIVHARDLSKNITQGFNTIKLASRMANDELALTNAKLEDQIAKIQGKPENHLRDALLE